MSTSNDFSIVTERGGELVSRGQLDRFHQRYLWAGRYCRDRDVLEMACGTGPGLGYLASRSRSLVAGDLSETVLAIARANYADSVRLLRFDAAATPFASSSFDVVILFEAIYYLPDAGAFAREAHRLLRNGGVLLIATANKDLPDFNPSPFSKCYFNPPELASLLTRAGFDTKFYGGSPVDTSGPRAKALRYLKRLAVALHLIPGSMRGKRLLKRIVFGPLVQMPAQFLDAGVQYTPPQAIDSLSPDLRHQVLYCVAQKMSQ
ncbi:MAG: Ubiquinone/menaquinone biosynthesis C-methyltransferase UbiE [Steroidobacteraceae bacterium]|nr:Ubiquinone/menaquinone biosynthesis C-methyltransferase UbiE [Steroidobacteraceae bacterium]